MHYIAIKIGHNMPAILNKSPFNYGRNIKTNKSPIKNKISFEVQNKNRNKCVVKKRSKKVPTTKK